MIETDRLQLISLPIACLQFLLAGDHPAAQATVGFTLPEDSSLLHRPWIVRRLRLIAEDPTQHPWMYRAIVQKSDNTMAGYISFHHKAPDPDLVIYSETAAVELGYTIEPAYRRRGYAKESALAMMQWAHTQHDVASFLLSISPENIASLRLAESMHFTKIAERMDDKDGLEFVFKATILTI
jgi:[ribosomal protein S5]-alanine N-acetyltransferase